VGTDPVRLSRFWIKDEYGIQFYDALIVAAAEAAGCETLYSKDRGDGPIYGGILIVNPFKNT
jgi:predicted nucleic acid-binding protein